MFPTINKKEIAKFCGVHYQTVIQQNNGTHRPKDTKKIREFYKLKTAEIQDFLDNKLDNYDKIIKGGKALLNNQK